MAELQHRRMTPDEFFDWQQRQEKNYELVDGFPVLHLKAMTGATTRHDRVMTNALVSLATQLRNSPCRAVSDDIATRTSISSVRRPDLTVDCGPFRDSATETQEATLVLEVLSPSTTDVDRFRKLDEYKSHPTIRLILLADTRAPKVVLWRRADSGWLVEEYMGRDVTIDLREISAQLPLSDLYEGLSFDKGPRS